MENIGSVEKARTKYLNTYVYHCVRSPGYVYELFCHKNNSYRCARCKRLGNSRYLTIVNDTVVSSSKHPEDDHVCQPIPVEGKCQVLHDEMCRSSIVKHVYRISNSTIIH